jgi:hypothetical protein
MLTKMQGILIPPMITLWAFWKYREAAFRPLVLCAVAGCGIMFLAWPWLWIDPVGHIHQYLQRASTRSTIYAWYFGERYTDRTAPWHFSLVMTAITLPAFVSLTLAWRFIRRRFDAAEQFAIWSVVWMLVIFSLPGTPVYDGTRLFLCCMPSIAFLAGRGMVQIVSDCMPERTPRAEPDQSDAASQRFAGKPVIRFAAAGGLCLTLVFLVRQLSGGSLISPFAINSYSDLIGGEAGASALGMEACYWGDALNGSFWKQVPEDSVVLVAPVLHQYQLADLQSLVPIVADRRLQLVPYEYDPVKQKGLMLLIHRLADLRQSLRVVPDGGRVVTEVVYNSVILARLMDTTAATWTETP